ncbi:hypothetical protein J1N35_035562 [Gossypium stocksii]|uniref:Uncharacterized protein n=1 Tax=Gossypium stocksii TaxID=47602 RepID=A0A9D3UU86_9ROSI|nr:hypothetical protein J1N35_035562 [Gossypium stocksii]
MRDPCSSYLRPPSKPEEGLRRSSFRRFSTATRNEKGHTMGQRWREGRPFSFLVKWRQTSGRGVLGRGTGYTNEVKRREKEGNRRVS